MTTVLIIFSIALLSSLVLTPLVKMMGIKLGALDKPDGRKIHDKPIPRVGGLAIFLATITALASGSMLGTTVSDLIVFDRQLLLLLAGGGVCFGIGIIDDFTGVKPSLKFLFQIIGSTLAFWGGIKFTHIQIFGVLIQFGPLDYFMTVFWFILFINALNLVDGLDGLAGGIAVFAAMIMVVLSVVREDFSTALFFAALGGSALGFLRYNFNPASIFLGDSGSYFLGYAIAGLSIMGSVKTQVSAVILIPLLALGVPIFDTILAPVRRFVRGRRMFVPDTGHVHHRLLARGLTTKRAVLFVYLITFCLCLLAVAMVNLRDERAGLFLIVLGVGAIIFVQKLGYFEYFATDKIYGWFRDMTDEAGLRHERRTFLGIQIEIEQSGSMQEMWDHVRQALRLLDFDFGALYLSNLRNASEGGEFKDSGVDRRKTTAAMSSVSMRTDPPDWVFSLEPGSHAAEIGNRCLFRLEMQLFVRNTRNYGTFLLLKDLERSAMDNFTLKRIESLRRSIIGAFERLEKAGALRGEFRL